MARQRNGRRGVTLVEVIVATGVLAIGLLGVAQTQVLTVRTNHFSRHMSGASALAHDLIENVRLWKYTDPRLTPRATVAVLDGALIKKQLDIGAKEVIASTDRPQFGDVAGDGNAETAGALGSYDGALSLRDDHDKAFYSRYWTVFAYDPEGDGTTNGKLVVVVIRWKEPGFGMRQVSITVFKANDEVFSL